MDIKEAIAEIRTRPSRWLGVRPVVDDLKAASEAKLLEAQGETAKLVARLSFWLFVFGAFCVLALASPDVYLVGATKRLEVLMFGPVPFETFLVLGPLILIALRVYLQIYVVQWYRLEEAISAAAAKKRLPVVSSMRNPLMRLVIDFIRHLWVPIVMVIFAWKAAALAGWDVAMAIAAGVVVAAHVLLHHRRGAAEGLQQRAIVVGLAVLAGVLTILLADGNPGSFRRPLDLERTDLSGEYLRNATFEGANIENANLRGAVIAGANLRDANLAHADLREADLKAADLRDANLFRADLQRAGLDGADLRNSVLSWANLRGANFGRIFVIPENNGGARDASSELAPATATTDISSAALYGADLRGVFGLTCDMLKTAKDWEYAFRDEALSCEANVPGAPLGRWPFEKF